MKYYSKKTKKLKKKMIEYQAKDNLDADQFERIEKLRRKRDSLLARGGKIERSHKKRVGDAVNKNIDKRYDAAGKAMERINSKKKLKEEWSDTIKDGKETFEIFKNPSQKEINDLVKNNDIRFIIDGKNKAIYVFDARLLHWKAAAALNIEYNIYNNGDYVFGADDAIQPGEKINAGSINRFKRQLISLLDKYGKSEWLWQYVNKPKNIINRERMKEQKKLKERYDKEMKER